MKYYFAFWFGWSKSGQGGQSRQNGQRGTIQQVIGHIFCKVFRYFQEFSANAS